MFFTLLALCANCVKLLDESHWGVRKWENMNQKGAFLDKLHRRTRSSLSCGDNLSGEAMRESNIYVLSVSATPFSEIAHNTSVEHKVYFHVSPGEGYYGVEHLLLGM